jgi:hypothetical protein
MPGDDDVEARLQDEHELSVPELLIEALASSEAELREHVASLQHDVVVYRELLQLALDELAATNIQRERLGARVQALDAELHKVRAALRTSEAARRAQQEPHA